MSKVGFIGLGIMGTPMAVNIRGGGHDLYVYDIKPVPKSLSDKGAVTCGSAKEVAEKAEIIITMVPDTAHVAAALFGEKLPTTCRTFRTASSPRNNSIMTRRRCPVIGSGE